MAASIMNMWGGGAKYSFIYMSFYASLFCVWGGQGVVSIVCVLQGLCVKVFVFWFLG